MAPKTCAVRGCHSRDGIGITMFRFPKDPARAHLWLEASNRGDLCEKPVDSLYKNYRLCEFHFEEKFISKVGCRKNLLFQAKPTLFPWLKSKDHIVLNNAPTKIAIQSDSIPQVGHSPEAATKHIGDASPSLDTIPFEQVGHSPEAATRHNGDASPSLDVCENITLEFPDNYGFSYQITDSDTNEVYLLDDTTVSGLSNVNLSTGKMVLCLQMKEGQVEKKLKTKEIPKCGECNQEAVGKSIIKCDIGCGKPFHISCVQLSRQHLDLLKMMDGVTWFCKNCRNKK